STGSDELNRKLSQDRADAVRGYLTEQGLHQDSVTAQGFGKSEPVADKSTAVSKSSCQVKSSVRRSARRRTRAIEKSRLRLNRTILTILIVLLAVPLAAAKSSKLVTSWK